MTEEKTPPAGGDDVVVVASQIADDRGVLAETAIAAEGNHALIVARFADTSLAAATYRALQQAEADGSLDIDGVLVVKANQAGKIEIQKMTDHSTRTGLKWGIVGGVVAAVFLPATIVEGAIALGAAGAAAGKARNVAHRIAAEKELADVIRPGTSGILALVSAPAVKAVESKLADAEEVKSVPVDEETAGDIKAAAVAADQATPAAG